LAAKLQVQDFRKMFTFTIDGKNTKAMDDAISIEEVTKYGKPHWKIFIHISAIHQFVRADSLLDKESAKQV
jgi:ribonuclease R